MSIDNAFGGIQSITSTMQAGAKVITRTVNDLGLGGASGAGTYWKDRLRPASYRGVPFGVLDSTAQFGRRNVVHQYPYRDSVWVEDMGKAARRVNITGFLVENGAYGGGDVIGQRQRLIAACEAPGDGELVHPTLGRMNISNLGLTTEERWDQGRVFVLKFSFIESGKRIYPGVTTSTSDAVKSAADAADKAVAQDFASKVASAIKQGAAVVSQAASTAAAWARKAQTLANDATNLYNMVGTLKGGFGRYFGGRRSGGFGGAAGAVNGAANTVSGLVALGSVARAGVTTAANALTSIASGLGS